MINQYIKINDKPIHLFYEFFPFLQISTISVNDNTCPGWNMKYMVPVFDF